jgi:uncharacterized protein (DUF4415 family)
MPTAKSAKQKKTKTDWNRLAKMKDQDIDYSDDPELDEEFWKNAEYGILANKRLLSIRLDSDVIQWFKEQGPFYQTRMNAVLRAYMKSKSTKQRRKV